MRSVYTLFNRERMTAEKIIDLNIDSEGIQLLSAIYHALDHQSRLEIMKLLHVYEEMSVMEIADKTNFDKENVSQHLSILKRAGLVFSKPHSKFRYYSLNYSTLERLKHSFDV